MPTGSTPAPSSGSETRTEAAVFEDYWSWVAVALFLLITVDMLTTVFAAAAYGPALEANPLLRWALTEGPVAFVTVNLLAVVLAVGFFYALRQMLRQTPQPYRRPFARLVETWLGLLVVLGLVLLANNLAVVVLGASLL